jgi:hypothetical protein
MTALAVAPDQAPIRKMQGIEVPAEDVNPDLFFERTKRHIYPEVSPRGWAGFGNSEQPMQVRRSDILSHLILRFVGTLTVTVGTGTVATTGRWPYDLAKMIRFNANGQSQLTACSGLKLKAREMVAQRELTDRSVSNSVGGVARTNGTLALASESWGVGSLATGIAGAPTNYPVDLRWEIPIADDEVDLAGAVYCPTTTTDLEVLIDWSPLAQLFALTGNAAVALAGNVSLEAVKYSIPEDADGHIIVPDLSLFHQFVQMPAAAPVGGPNEPRLSGQGPGKSLLRILGQIWNNTGTATEAPLVLNDTNFNVMSWKYATSEEPDRFISGSSHREFIERLSNSDLGGVWGFFMHDFASQNALRDIVDMGTHSEIRAYYEIGAGVVLATPKAELVQELMFRAGD